MKKELIQDEPKERDVLIRLKDAGLLNDFAEANTERDETRIRSILETIQIPNEQLDWWLHFLAYYSERLKIDDPNGFIPLDKHDLDRAERAVAAGYPAVEPVLSHLLEWIQDMNWPVAKTLAPFLASIGKPLVPHIKKVFEGDDEIWKYWIMHEIFLRSAVVAEDFRCELERIAYEPNESEIQEEIVDDAKMVLEHYGWKRA